MLQCKIWIVALGGGVVSTLVMTMVILSAGMLMKKKLNVPALLGAMMTAHIYDGTPRNSIITLLFGWTMHFSVGIILSLVLAIVFQMNGGEKITVLVAGLIAGMFASLCWAVYLNIYRTRLNVNLKLWVIWIFIGHQLFTWLDYQIFLLSENLCN